MCSCMCMWVEMKKGKGMWCNFQKRHEAKDCRGAGLDFRQMQSVEEARSAALEALRSHAGVADDNVVLQEIPRSPTVCSFLQGFYVCITRSRDIPIRSRRWSGMGAPGQVLGTIPAFAVYRQQGTLEIPGLHSCSALTASPHQESNSHPGQDQDMGARDRQLYHLPLYSRPSSCPWWLLDLVEVNAVPLQCGALDLPEK